MEILGICLTVISLIGAYLWRANGKLQKAMMNALTGIGEGQKVMMNALTGIGEGQKAMMNALTGIGEGQKVMMQALERIEEGQKILVEGQREIAQILQGHTQMLLAQTRILERIEGKIPAPSVG